MSGDSVVESGIPAIETRYAGCRFRSRVEARWARFFDAVKWEWQYEIEGFNLGRWQLEQALERGFDAIPDSWFPLHGYLPDFYVKVPLLDIVDGCPREAGSDGFWFEVKGTEPVEDEMRRLESLCFGQSCVLEKPVTGLITWDGIPECMGELKMRTHTGRDVAFALLRDGRVCIAPDALGEDVVLTRALQLARSARFEFGEQG